MGTNFGSPSLVTLQTHWSCFEPETQEAAAYFLENGVNGLRFWPEHARRAVLVFDGLLDDSTAAQDLARFQELARSRADAPTVVATYYAMSNREEGTAYYSEQRR